MVWRLNLTKCKNFLIVATANDKKYMFRIISKERWEYTSLSDSSCCSEPVSYAAVEEDGTSGLVIEGFDDLDKVCADVVFLHGCPQSCMPNPVKGLLEVYEDMVEDLLVLEIFLTENRPSNPLLNQHSSGYSNIKLLSPF